MQYKVHVRLKPGVLDVQGKAIEKGIKDYGIDGISDVRVGKLIEFTTDSNTDETTLTKICDELLSNPIIEDFEVAAEK